MSLDNMQNVLDAREERVIEIQKLINTFYKTVVVLKLNIPGPIKHGGILDWAFEQGYKRFMNVVSNVIFSECITRASGKEAYFVLDLDAIYIKKLTIQIEEKDDLGRLFDFDVYDNFKTIGRDTLGKEERSCIICGEPVWNCSRSRRHSILSLQNKVTELIKSAIKKEEEEHEKNE